MSSRGQQPIGVTPSGTALLLLAAASILLVMHLLAWGLEGQIPIETADKALTRFNLNSEQSVPAWFSSMMLLFAAGLLGWTAASVRRMGLPDGWRWFILAAIFVMLSMDEAASFHEMLSAPVREQINPGGIFRYAWVIPGIIGCVVLGAFYLPMVRRLPGRTRTLIVVAGATYLGGALGFEMMSAAFLDRDGYYSVPYKLAATGEEAMEMAGVIVFIYALMDQLTRLSLAHVMPNGSEPAIFTIRFASRPSLPARSSGAMIGRVEVSSTSAK